MKCNVDYESIVKKAPDLVENLTKQMLKKLEKNENYSKNPKDWNWSFDWSQRIQGLSFQDVLEGKKMPKKAKEETLEEKVFNFFKNGDIFLMLKVRYQKKENSCNFYNFQDSQFFIPQEIINAYDENYKMREQIKEKTQYDSLFVYKKENEKNFLEENIILCGLTKNDQNFILLKSPKGEELVYEYQENDNNLYARMIFFSEKNIQKEKVFKLGKEEYQVISSEDVLKKLNQTQMIRDENTYVTMLLQALSKSKGFVQFGALAKIPKNNKIPINAPVVYLPKMETEKEILKKNQKFKIK
jgi:hypothetical protein